MTDLRTTLLDSPRSWLTWTYAVALVAGTIVLIVDLALMDRSMPAAFWVITLVWAIVLTALLALFIRWLDQYGGNVRELLLAGFVWGGLAATGFAMVINDSFIDIFDRDFGAYQEWGNAAVAPVAEEALKGIGILLVVLIGRRYIVRPFQAAVVGAATGLGFQFTENIVYMFNAGSGNSGMDTGSDLSDLLNTALGRTISALDTHWMLSALLGLGIGYALVRRDQPGTRRGGILVLTAGGAWLGHFVIDSPKPEDANLPVSVAELIVILAIAYYAAYKPAMQAEWRRFAAVAAEEPHDVIAPADVEAMRTRRTRRAARRNADNAAGEASQLQDEQLRLVNAELRGDETTGLRENVRRIRAMAYPATGADAERGAV